MPTIQSLSRPALIEAIRALGEEPPASWHKPELQIRLAELEEEKGIFRTKGRQYTNLQAWMVQLNKATTKKANLIVFCREQLGLTISDTALVAEMQRKAIEKIYLISEAEDQDPVGFGCHASLSYLKTYNEYPEYLEWALATMNEGHATLD